MSKSRKGIPSVSKIRDYWADELIFAPDNTGMESYVLAVGSHTGWDSPQEFREESGACFACGMDWSTEKYTGIERAHILAACEGGSHSVDNLHMLCHYCHKSSESLAGVRYWLWLKNRSSANLILSAAFSTGLIDGGDLLK